ncbi:MAG: hypothetical protein QM754_18590 [Tepidisphaeraceae bacterium]
MDKAQFGLADVLHEMAIEHAKRHGRTLVEAADVKAVMRAATEQVATEITQVDKYQALA